MRTGSLFSGYLGLEMAVNEVFGATTAWVSDIDKGACKILAHRAPDVPNLGDITSVDWASVEPVDILTGGSPCQDLSHAGKRQGMSEGTRSNLWVAMREAIAQLRPRIVVWENVRGAYSACADSELGCCPRCLDEGYPGGHAPLLRALGRVLGDLSDLGYDTRWHGLRAADVGVPHGRFRVFVVAYPYGTRLEGRERRQSTHARPAVHCGALLPTPRTSDTNGAGAHGDGGLDLRTAVGLLPTPRATDGTKGGPNQRGSSGDLMLPSAVANLLPTPQATRGGSNTETVSLLPTPAVNDMGAGKTVEDWDAWTAKMKAEHGNGHGPSLSIEALRLLPTPTSSDYKGSTTTRRQEGMDRGQLDAVVEGSAARAIEAQLKNGVINASPTEVGSEEGLRDVRDTPDAQTIRQRETRGQDGVPEAEALLPEVREQPQGNPARQPQVAGPTDCQRTAVSGLRSDRAPACTSPRQEPSEQRRIESHHALCVVPSAAALAGGSGATCGCGTNWGQYEAAIRRWEWIIGRAAPSPTQLSTKGRPQLDPRFSEFMMGLPAGWVTGTPGITRNEALKAIGNGVCPQQAVAALRVMLAWEAVA